MLNGAVGQGLAEGVGNAWLSAQQRPNASTFQLPPQDQLQLGIGTHQHRCGLLQGYQAGRLAPVVAAEGVETMGFAALDYHQQVVSNAVEGDAGHGAGTKNALRCRLEVSEAAAGVYVGVGVAQADAALAIE